MTSMSVHFIHLVPGGALEVERPGGEWPGVEPPSSLLNAEMRLKMSWLKSPSPPNSGGLPIDDKGLKALRARFVIRCSLARLSFSPGDGREVLLGSWPLGPSEVVSVAGLKDCRITLDCDN